MTHFFREGPYLPGPHCDRKELAHQMGQTLQPTVHKEQFLRVLGHPVSDADCSVVEQLHEVIKPEVHVVSCLLAQQLRPLSSPRTKYGVALI